MTQDNREQGGVATAEATNISPADQYRQWKQAGRQFNTLTPDEQKIWTEGANALSAEENAAKGASMKAASRAIARINNSPSSRLSQMIISTLSGDIKSDFSREDKANQRRILSVGIQRLRDQKEVLEKAVAEYNEYLDHAEACLDTPMRLDMAVFTGLLAGKKQLFTDVVNRAAENAAKKD